MPDLNDWAKTSHDVAKSKGWHDPSPALPIQLMNVVGEVAEANEALRNRDPENFQEELADTIIRVLDICGSQGIDIEKAVADKTEKNRNRPILHGGKAY